MYRTVDEPRGGERRGDEDVGEPGGAVREERKNDHER